MAVREIELVVSFKILRRGRWLCAMGSDAILQAEEYKQTLVYQFRTRTSLRDPEYSGCAMLDSILSENYWRDLLEAAPREISACRISSPNDLRYHMKFTHVRGTTIPRICVATLTSMSKAMHNRTNIIDAFVSKVPLRCQCECRYTVAANFYIYVSDSKFH